MLQVNQKKNRHTKVQEEVSNSSLDGQGLSAPPINYLALWLSFILD